MGIGERIKARRLELNLTQEELAMKMGYKSKSTINKIELGINDIPLSKVEEFAAALSTSVPYLMEWTDPKPLPANIHLVNKVKNVPILGKICAGNGVVIEENFQGTMAVDSRVPCDYILYVQGDSMMNANICDGDMVYVVKRNDIWENGKIHVMGIYGTEDGVIRRVDVLEDGRYLLTPSNPAYAPKIYSRDEAFVIGIVTGVFRAF